MSDHGDNPFNPNENMFLAPAENENLFSRTPANVTTDFIHEARLNTATAPSTTLDEIYQVPMMDIAGPPASIPARAMAAPAAPAVKKRKRITTMRVTTGDEPSGMAGSPAAASTPAVVKNVSPFDSPDSLPATKKQKRTRKPGAKQLNARVIPRSLDECDDADKELITLRESGAEWKTIRLRWAEMTGENTATSTLPNRYARLKYVEESLIH